MKKLSKLLVVCFIMLCIGSNAQSPAVQSALINFGTNACGDNSNVSFSSIGKPNGNSYLISSCGLSSVFSDVFNKFIAYNPKDNKIYINDISHGDSRVYVYDMGLPNNYTCPASMPQTPTYQYSYVPNNWEFDINGNVWCIKGLNGNFATIETIDETTGTILSSKTLDFPANNVPNSLWSGDIVILPNGRLFIVVGDSPGKFYEITNYTANTSGDAVANFIQDMPRPCYGILYMNGTIELTGTDFGSNCYKYLYDIPSKVMTAGQPFQLGMSPIDNASLSPATGISMQLISSTLVDATTADIKYELHVNNMGNVKLNNFNVTDDLVAAFGIGNVSNVSVNLDANANPGNLAINTSFDGVNNIKIFNDNLVLSNLGNGYADFTISLRATNLIAEKTYYNTAKSMGQIGEEGIKVAVVDSSNNGGAAAVDPNNDGDAGDNHENVPTPYFFGFVLPVQFINVNAANTQSHINTVTWTIGATQKPLLKYEVEYSEDGKKWELAGTVDAIQNATSYSFNHNFLLDNTIYYRVRACGAGGQNYLSKEVMVKTQDAEKIVIHPVPADDAITVNSAGAANSPGRMVYISDATGKQVFSHSFDMQHLYIHTSSYPGGYYIVNVLDKGKLSSFKIMIRHN